jgi:uncharacterized protein (TIGR00661 family)
VRLLYGVVGEGMGHATRSRVVLGHLLDRGHEVRVLVSGRAFRFLSDAFRGRAGIEVREIAGLVLAYRGNEMDPWGSVRANLRGALGKVRRNLDAVAALAEEGFEPRAVISDYDSWTYLYGRSRRIPVVDIDNIQALRRLRHPRGIADGLRGDFAVARLATAMRLPGAWHYLVPSFFFPPVRLRRTTIVPPILRAAILEARREPRDHVLVYQTAASNEALVPLLRRLAGEFRVYGMGREGREGNVALRPFSEAGFVEDLRTARAVVAGGGFSLMSEAVHLRVPMLSVPVARQAEQVMNARWLARLGYGACAERFTEEAVAGFLADLPARERALRAYEPRDNGTTFRCVDELLGRIGRGDRKPDRLEFPAMGKWELSGRGRTSP